MDNSLPGSSVDVLMCLVAQSCLTLWDPMDCSSPGSRVHGDSPGNNTGVGCHSLLQGIFPTQGSNPGLLHCRLILYHPSHQGSSGYIYGCCSLSHCLTLCNPMNCSMSGFPVLHYLPEFAQASVPWVTDAIQPSHSLLAPSPLSFNLSHHQGLFRWVSSLHQVAKVLELQLQHQSFQWIFRVDFL